LLIAWTLIPHPWWDHTGFLMLAWPISAYWRRSKRANPQRPAVEKNEWREGLRVMVLAIPLVLFVAWGSYMQLHPLVILACALFFIGLLLFSGAIESTANRYLLGWALGLMAAGLAVPGAAPFSSISADALIGGVFIVGGTWAAWIRR
jgi:uncharacterized membrane protein YgdD (TMEM256/DUF423 family)